MIGRVPEELWMQVHNTVQVAVMKNISKKKKCKKAKWLSEEALQITEKTPQMRKDDALKELHSIYQQIWKTQQWPQDW